MLRGSIEESTHQTLAFQPHTHPGFDVGVLQGSNKRGLESDPLDDFTTRHKVKRASTSIGDVLEAGHTQELSGQGAGDKTRSAIFGTSIGVDSRSRPFDFADRLKELETEWIRFHHLLLAHNASTTAGKDREVFTLDVDKISDVGLTASELEGISMNRQRVLQRGSRHGLTCRHWYQGVCHRGDDCEYQHLFDFDKPIACQNVVRFGKCLPFLKGFCQQYHPPAPERPPSTNNTQTHEITGTTLPKALSKATDGECASFAMGFCPYGSRCRLNHSARLPDELPALLPLWYLKYVTSMRTSLPHDSSALTADNRAKLSATNERLLPLVQNVLTSRDEPSQQSSEDVGHRTDVISEGVDHLPTPLQNECLFLESNDSIPGLQSTDQMRLLCKKVLTQPNPMNYHYSMDPMFGEFESTHRKIPVRFFVIKSLQMRNIYTSVQLGIWATGRFNTRQIAQAFHTCDNVILFFSANESGGYQGFARVMSSPDPNLHYGIWGPYTPRLGPNFRVQWLKQCRIQFEQLLSPTDYYRDSRAVVGANAMQRQSLAMMTNLLNEDKPIKKGRDCTEYSSGLGVILARKLAMAKDEDILQGTEFEALPRIDHQQFFGRFKDEWERHRHETELGFTHLYSFVTGDPSHTGVQLRGRGQY